MRAMPRRTFLRGAAGVCVGLPMLSAMESKGGGMTAPKRLVVFFTNDGTVPSAWLPTGTEDDFVLGPILSPLAPFQDRLLVLAGLDMESSYHGPGSGDPHMPGMAHMLTGTEMVDTGPGQYDKMGGGISVDQFVAQQLAAPTKFPSLHFGIQSRKYGASPWNTMSYLGPNQPVDPEDDPVQAFDRIFAELSGTAEEIATLRAQRHSVLDVVTADIEALQGQLGSEDRMRLERHLDAIRGVEQVIDAGGPLGASCTIPPVPGAVAGLYEHASAPALMKTQTELLVMALACDTTRVATLQWQEALGGDSTFVWLGHAETHHDISHKGDGDAVGRQQMIDINTWFSEQLAYMLQLMDAIPEGDGTLLDNTVVLWCNELARGNAHDRRAMPYVLAGGAGGYFRTGRFLQYQGAWHNDLLVSLCNAMDVPVTTFGNPAYCTGALPNLI